MNRKYIYILFGLLLGVVLIITSCQRDEEVIVSTITTNDPTYIHADNAGISVELDYNGTPKQYGICYSTEPSPTIKNQLALCADSVEQLCELVGLEAATMYYARAFVQNSSDVLYGNEITFTTAERLTEAGYEYVDMGLSVKWATMNVGATVPEEGGKYYAWGEVEEKETYMWDNYHYGNSRTTLTKYCDSEAYGTVDNKAVLDLLDDAAYMSWGGKWRMPTYNEWDELLRNSTWTWVEQNGVKGVRVRSTKNGNCIFLPTTGYKVGADLNNKDINIVFWTSSLSKNGSYMSYGVSVESPNNTASFYGFNRYNGYPIRAVMDNAITPPTVDVPTVVTIANEVTKNSAVVGGNVMSDGGLEVTERGVYYSMSANAMATGTKIECGTGLGEFIHNLTNLQTGATYYVRAYAKNKFGVAYGEEISFVCEALPTVATTQPTNVSYTSATIGGNVTDNGGLEVTERGICYSTSANPTTANTKITSGSGLGGFTCNLTDLQDGVTYYARAYAINEKGTTYGEEVSFTTKVKTVATVTTSQATNISYTSATVGGNVTDDGGLEVTERGVVYGTSQNPTIENIKVTNGSGLGEFTCNLADLQDGVTYYARAYAINAKGTAYGEEVSFTTIKIGDPLTFTVNGISFTMIAVQGGTFTMGATSEQGIDAFNDEKPTHKVTLSDYMIGETEVTQELWKAVMGTNPSYFSGTQNPVERVSWEDCQNFIAELNAMTGKKFRLPTEAEWEYAARGGNKSNGFKYSGSGSIDKVAWYYGNSSSTHPVKQKQANELGIYDMSGNVYEWCQDWIGIYSISAQTNPTGPSSGSARVHRGGSWYYNARNCRVSCRRNNAPTYSFYDLGLRLAL